MNKASRGSAEKKGRAEVLTKKIAGYKSVALVEASGFPSDNFEQVRKIFRGKADFVYTNKVVIYNALKNSHPTLAEKVKEVRMPVLMLTDLDPFETTRIAMENKTYTKIKTGEKAPMDIVLPSGPTPFPPGPMLSQFSSVGVKTKNEGGKISIISDTTVVKKGEPVSEKVASILSSMDIRPKELMLSVSYALTGAITFGKEILYRTRESYLSDVSKAFSESLALSIGAGILNKYSIKSVIKKAYIGVKFLSVNRNILTKSTVNDIITKASLQADALAKITGGK